MRKVMSNKDVARVWFEGAQSYGRNGKKSFYFENNIIYSYGRHFPVARKVASNFVLLSSERERRTTMGHVGLARHTARSATVISTIDVHETDLNKVLDDIQTRINDCIDKCSKGRQGKWWQLRALCMEIVQFKQCAKFAELDRDPLLPSRDWWRTQQQRIRWFASDEYRDAKALKRRLIGDKDHRTWQQRHTHWKDTIR